MKEKKRDSKPSTPSTLGRQKKEKADDLFSRAFFQGRKKEALIIGKEEECLSFLFLKKKKRRKWPPSTPAEKGEESARIKKREDKKIR